MKHSSTPSLFSRSRALRVGVSAITAATLVHLQWWSIVNQGPVHADWIATAHAQAAAHSTLAILCVPGNKKAADEAEGIERLLFEATRRLDTVRGYDLSPPPAPELTQKAAENVEDALRALLLRTPKRAGERLAAASQALAEAPNAGDERVQARFHKAQGLAHLANNDLVKARDAFAKSLSLYPSQSVDEYVSYGAASRDMFQSVKELIANMGTGDLKVVTKGSKGDVIVDGIYRGTGVAVLEDLPAGPHRVVVRAPGMNAERKTVEIVTGKVTTAEVELKVAAFASEVENGRKVLMDNFTQPSVVEDRVRELRNQIGADQMLLVRPKLGKKTTELSGFYLGSDGVFKKVDVVIDKDEKYLDKLAEFVAATVGSKLVADPQTAPLDVRQSVVTKGQAGAATDAASAYIDPNAPLFDDKREEERPITKEWWFWTAIGAGAALVGVGIYALTRGTAEATQPTGTLQFMLNTSAQKAP